MPRFRVLGSKNTMLRESIPFLTLRQLSKQGQKKRGLKLLTAIALLCLQLREQSSTSSMTIRFSRTFVPPKLLAKSSPSAKLQGSPRPSSKNTANIQRQLHCARRSTNNVFLTLCSFNNAIHSEQTSTIPVSLKLPLQTTTVTRPSVTDLTWHTQSLYCKPQIENLFPRVPFCMGVTFTSHIS